MKIEIGNKILAVYIVYILFIWFCECIDFFCFCINVPQQTIISRLFVIPIIGVFLYYVKDKVYFPVDGKHKRTKIIVVIIITTMGLIKSLYPDRSFDVGNYHLIAQSSDFENWFENGFAAGNFQIWGFRLGDRLFNVFINILGYRYGTLLNLFVVVLVYLQITDLLEVIIQKMVLDSRNDKFLKILNPAILSIAAISVHDLVMEVATYNVDLLPIPLLIEMLRKIIVKNENTEHTYFALLGGLTFAIKMTNIVFVVPLLAIYIMKNLKSITFGDWIRCLAIGIMPFGIYAIYNFLCTGNPVFPYFNLVFKSQYYITDNFKDNRWGPTNNSEGLLWIFNHIFNTEFRQSEIPNLHAFNLQIAFIVSVICAMVFIINSVIKKTKISFLIEIYIAFAVSALLWSFSTGYSRYFIFGDMMLLIILIISVLYLISFIDIGLLKYGFVICLYGLIWFTLDEIDDSIDGREWSWRAVTKEGTINQVLYVLKDRPEVFEYKDADVFFMTHPGWQSYAWLSNNRAPIFNVKYLDNLDLESKYLYIERFQEIVSKKQNIYDVKFSDFNDWEAYEEDLYNYGFGIVDKYAVNNGVFDIVYIKLEYQLEDELPSILKDEVQGDGHF